MSFDFVIFLLAWAIPKYRTNERRVNRCQAESNSQACLAMPRREGGRRSQACLNIAEAQRRKTKSSLLGSYIVVTGGIAVTAGGRMGSSGTSSIGTATQGYYLGSSPSSYSSANYYTLCNTSGEAICTYKFASNVSNSLGLLTAPNLGKGSISVKSGTAKPTAWDINVDDVFFINPTVITSSTAATVTTK